MMNGMAVINETTHVATANVTEDLSAFSRTNSSGLATPISSQKTKDVAVKAKTFVIGRRVAAWSTREMTRGTTTAIRMKYPTAGQ